MPFEEVALVFEPCSGGVETVKQLQGSIGFDFHTLSCYCTFPREITEPWQLRLWYSKSEMKLRVVFLMQLKPITAT